ncbi:MAG: hypothetical protein NC120_05150 [Ruminococcus sp.]|nr:hypothetical protein [Ruminococcus sp.]
MTCAEAAALMMGGGGGGTSAGLSELELPISVDYSIKSGQWGNVLVTETFAKTEEHGEYTRHIGLNIYNLGTPSEYVSSMYIYNKGYNPLTGVTEAGAQSGYHFISFGSFYTQ